MRSLWRRINLGKRIENGIESTAYVHSRTRPPQPVPRYVSGAKFNLVVREPGGGTRKVSLKCSAPGDRFPDPGQTVPILIDPADPDHVQIDWERIQTADEQFEAL